MSDLVANTIVTQLELRGVPRVYQVPGESFLGLLDALRDSPIDLITARHEGGAGFMAVAEARLTGRAGVVAVTRGPGAANASIAIHTAYQDCTPLVVFVGLISTHVRDLESFQEFDLKAWFGSTAKAVFVLDHPASAAERVARAFEIAESGRPGPVVVGLPEEVLVQRAPGVVPVPRTERPPLALTAASVSAAVGAIDAAERPVFVVGGDGWNAEAAALLRRVAEQAGIPVVSDFRAHDAFPHESPAWVGSLGFGRNAGAAEAYGSADLVCYLGTVRRDVLSDEYTLGGDESCTIVVSPDADLLGHEGQVSLQYVADPQDWLRALTSVRAATPARIDRLQRERAAYLEWSTPAAERTGEDEWRGSVFGEMQRQLPEDAIITVGAGNYVIGALRYLHHQHPRTFIGPRNGAMGMGVPAAVAASHVHRGRTVVALAGDGCFGMNGQELATLQATGGRAIIIVFDNAGFGTIHSHQERHFPGRPAGTSLTNPDYALLARAHGIEASAISDVADFGPALRRALAADGSTLLWVQLPPVPTGAALPAGGREQPSGVRA
ncbi:thiamine pyrophosphate-dependent enzyme [Leucobacter manosquensis]|uniref:Acetolactate synthase n=1 Tax=Leucobacter manosquensis TaxID=2810611 RepID=A0ABS5M7C6_9MICO|nr:thiamine pyrophosphate-dependent enzyme [Leucobacter manosquensis]MBS3183114.1 acetolactate synthase [Leucobacter manosquensis]